MDITQKEAHQFCVEDFYRSLEKATEDAGGSIKAFREAERFSLKDLAELLAPNGVRFIYNRNRTIGNVSTISIPCFRPASIGTADPIPKKK